MAGEAAKVEHLADTSDRTGDETGSETGGESSVVGRAATKSRTISRSTARVDATASVAANKPARTWRQVARSRPVLVIIVVCVAVAVLAFWRGFQRPGHDTGDDFALYMNQTRALVDGDVGLTIANNKFAVDNSAWHTFSPYVYPWGEPLLMAPVAALTGVVDPVTGIDYAPYKLVISLTLLAALGAYFLVARRRVHAIVAGALVLFFVIDRSYAGATDAVLSEFPFLMWIMFFVWWLDRLVAGRGLLGASRRSLIVLASFAWMAFETRREGLGLLVGLAAAQAVAVYVELGPGTVRARLSRLAPKSAAGLSRAVRGALLTPWITFIGLMVALQLVLPTDFLPRYSERDPAASVGLWRIPDNIGKYRPLFGELLGFKVDSGVVTIRGSVSLATVVMLSIMLLAGIGIVVSLLRSTVRDAGLVGSFLGLTFVVLYAPFQATRYLMCLVPFVLLFAAMGVMYLFQLALVRKWYWSAAVTSVLVALLISVGLGDSLRARSYSANWTGPASGVQLPETLEMFEQIRDHTRGDAVIVFGRARTMTLYTSRRSVQGGALDFTRRSGDYYAMYLNDDGTPGDYSQYPLTDAEASQLGFVEMWRNSRWVIFKIPETGVEW